MADIFQHSIKINDKSITILNKKSVKFTNAQDLAQWLYLNKHTTNTTGYLVGGSSGTAITVDTALSNTSTNPVENRVITDRIGNLTASANYLTTVTNELIDALGETRAELNNYVLKSALYDLIYPINSIYITYSKDVNPNTLFGVGNWQRVGGDRALWIANPNTFTENNRYLNAGLPNITGSTKYLSPNAVWNNTADGCFTGYQGGGPDVTNLRTSGSGGGYKFNFDASASNSIYGNSSTVQPPALQVFVWYRVS